jgi:hypothetical protein
MIFDIWVAIGGRVTSLLLPMSTSSLLEQSERFSVGNFCSTNKGACLEAQTLITSVQNQAVYPTTHSRASARCLPSRTSRKSNMKEVNIGIGVSAGRGLISASNNSQGTSSATPSRSTAKFSTPNDSGKGLSKRSSIRLVITIYMKYQVLLARPHQGRSRALG